MPETIHITPISGWGWRDESDKLVDLPAAFDAVGTKTIDGLWIGNVALGLHPFAGRAIKLSQRHVEPNGFVNIEIEPDIVGFASMVRRSA